MTSRWERIKQRKLIRWALAYVAAALLVIGVASDLAQGFAWAVVALRVLSVVLAIGFLAALVIAWYHGEKGRQRAGALEILLLAGLLVMAVAAAWFAAKMVTTWTTKNWSRDHFRSTARGPLPSRHNSDSAYSM